MTNAVHELMQYVVVFSYNHFSLQNQTQVASCITSTLTESCTSSYWFNIGLQMHSMPQNLNKFSTPFVHWISEYGLSIFPTGQWYSYRGFNDLEP